MRRLLLSALLLGTLCLIWTVPARTAYDAGPIASDSGSSSGGASVTTAGMNTTGADLLVLSVGYYRGSGEPAISDSKSNTWNALTTPTPTADNQGVKLYWSSPSSVGSGHTFTNSTANFSAVCVTAWKVSNATPFDSQSGHSSDSSAVTSIQPGSLTPTISNTNALVITSMVQRNVAATMSIDSSFTIAPTQVAFSGGNHLSNAQAYKVITSGSENPTWSWSGADTAATAMASFKDGGGGSPTSHPCSSLRLLGVGCVQ